MAVEVVPSHSPKGDAPHTAASRELPWPAPASAWYTVGILALVLMLSQLDRGVITLLVQPIKRDLHLTDTQVSLLIGFAFILFYTFIGVPLSRFSDRKSRRTIIALGVAFWSLATAACGLAQNFWQLFFARIGIGAGESVNAPATFSLLADCFPPAKLPRAIAVLNIGYLAGSGSSLLLGSLVVSLLPSTPDIVLPVIGTIHGWQLVFLIVGLPGLLVSAIMFTVREPARRGTRPASGVEAIPFRAVLRYLWANRRVYGPMYIGLAVSSLGTAGTLQWMPTFYQRSFGWSIAEAGTVTGLLALVIGPFGLYGGTWLVERYGRLGRNDANLRVVAIGYTVAIPFAVAGPLMPTPWLALSCSGVGAFFGLFGSPAATAALQIITPNGMRSQATSLYLLMLSAIGMGFGPTIVAMITDYVLGSEALLRYAMSIAAALTGPAAAWLIWSGVKPYGEAVSRLRV